MKESDSIESLFHIPLHSKECEEDTNYVRSA